MKACKQDELIFLEQSAQQLLLPLNKNSMKNDMNAMTNKQTSKYFS